LPEDGLAAPHRRLWSSHVAVTIIAEHSEPIAQKKRLSVKAETQG